MTTFSCNCGFNADDQIDPHAFDQYALHTEESHGDPATVCI